MRQASVKLARLISALHFKPVQAEREHLNGQYKSSDVAEVPDEDGFRQEDRRRRRRVRLQRRRQRRRQNVAGKESVDVPHVAVIQVQRKYRKSKERVGVDKKRRENVAREERWRRVEDSVSPGVGCYKAFFFVTDVRESLSLTSIFGLG